MLLYDQDYDHDSLPAPNTNTSAFPARVPSPALSTASSSGKSGRSTRSGAPSRPPRSLLRSPVIGAAQSPLATSPAVFSSTSSLASSPYLQSPASFGATASPAPPTAAASPTASLLQPGGRRGGDLFSSQSSLGAGVNRQPPVSAPFSSAVSLQASTSHHPINPDDSYDRLATEVYSDASIPPSSAYEVERYHRTTEPLRLDPSRQSSHTSPNLHDGEGRDGASSATTIKGNMFPTPRHTQPSSPPPDMSSSSSQRAIGPSTSTIPDFPSKPISASSSPRLSQEGGPSSMSRKNAAAQSRGRDSPSLMRISNSTQRLISFTAVDMRDLAKGKRTRRDGSQTSQSIGSRTRNSLASLASVMSSTGDSIYEDAIEGEWSSVDDEERSGEEDNSEDQAGDETAQAIPEDANLGIGQASSSSMPTTAASTDHPASLKLFSPVSSANFDIASINPNSLQRRISIDSARSMTERRASLHAGYGSSLTSSQSKRVSLTQPGPTVIPLRRYSGAFNPRLSTPDFGSSKGSNASDHDHSNTLEPTLSPRRASFVPKPLVLTPARTLVAPLTTTSSANVARRGSISPTLGSSTDWRRSTDLYNLNGAVSHSRRSSSDVDGPVLLTSRRQSTIGYVGPQRDSIVSAGGSSQQTHLSRTGSSGGGNGGAYGQKWTERRKRSVSEDTGQTRTSESFGIGERQTNSGESPDSSVSGWSEERATGPDATPSELAGAKSGSSDRDSPSSTDKEWEHELVRRGTTPLDVVTESPDISMVKNKQRSRDAQHIIPVMPSIELSQPSPVRGESGLGITRYLKENGNEEVNLLSLPNNRDIETESPTPPPTIPLPGLPRSASQIAMEEAVPRPSRKDSHNAGYRGLSIYDENWDGSMVIPSSPSTVGAGTASPANSPLIALSPQSQWNGFFTRGREVTTAVGMSPTAAAAVNRASHHSGHSTIKNSAAPEIQQSLTLGARMRKPISIGSTKPGEQTVAKRLSMSFTRKGKDAVTAASELTKDGTLAAQDRLARQHSANTLKQQSSRGSFDPSPTPRKSSDAGLAIWPPPNDGHTRMIHAGPRMIHSSDSSEEYSPVLSDGEIASSRPNNWGTRASRRPSVSTTTTYESSNATGSSRRRSIMLEPRDPRTRNPSGPEDFFEVLMSSEPSAPRGSGDSQAGFLAASARERRSPGELGGRWSYYSNGTVGSSGTPGSSAGHVFPTGPSSSHTSPVLQQQPLPTPVEAKKKRPISRFLTGFTRKGSKTPRSDAQSSGDSTRARSPMSIPPTNGFSQPPRPSSAVKKPILIAPRASRSARDHSALPRIYTEAPPSPPMRSLPMPNPDYNPPPIAPSALDARRPLSTIDSRPESLASGAPTPSLSAQHIPAFRSVSPLFKDAEFASTASKRNELPPLPRKASDRAAQPYDPEPYAEEIRLSPATPSAKSSMDDLRGTPRNFVLPPGLAPPLPAGAVAGAASFSGQQGKGGSSPGSPPAPLDIESSLSISPTSSRLSPNSTNPSDPSRSPVMTSLTVHDNRSRGSSVGASSSYSRTSNATTNQARASRRGQQGINPGREDHDEYEGYHEVRQGPIGVRDVFRTQLLER
ncbi:BZ3500_MvSof-1268-A1-R1_Chr8-1g09836 [Microbotryum saponariae]|uniref:BZ3500_MvSof-1268-A1-R1_Chr8-1g09836 protein n=1 Tax=Microbotryum saponariae TaxID=289078 RepID=A0A2X0KU40_9BASI|nr:BZ3500_MvSof-1268-A1-R1_Chr8-1g09836 [Microbotryum saponariae]SDA08122.1 BZ3501_MvSof-1269-A2-R1_Chr8-1g09559 [Microbotryum saponariae]